VSAGPTVNISDRLRATVDRSGSDARAWVERLPALLRATTAAWGLDLQQQLTHDGHASVTFHVLTGAGEPAVLKLSLPDEETRFEATALDRWAGDGAVRLLRASDDGYILLLERCAPGRDLWTVDTVEQIEVIVDLLPRLWRHPQEGDPFPEVSDTVAGWVARMPELARSIDVPDEVAADVRSWARELKGDGPRRLLHGDLHPSNILAAERAPWLAIDPKPWIGDPAFDLAQVLVNWVWVDATTVGAPERMLRRRAEALAERLGLSTDRVLRWGAVKALGWECGRIAVLTLHAAARRT
jgi:streptomycin 6-kinase